MATRDFAVLFVNGARREVRGSDCFLSLSDFLRYRLGLTGTKVVCSEGDCGSCTVLVGSIDGSRLKYKPIDSCIQFMFQLDGVHVVTVEGLSRNGQLLPVQSAIVECHGSQCGYCTPGFVMTMAGALENGQCPDPQDWPTELTGNLCRCTGYTPIFEAAERAAAVEGPRCNDLYPPEGMIAEFAKLAGDSLDLREESYGRQRRAVCPTSVQEAVELRSQLPDAKVIAGATDVGVQVNKRTIDPATFISLNRIRGLDATEIDRTNGLAVLTVGAQATWTTLLEAFEQEVPQFAEIISVFGSPQIRHAGTLGGNIINASPIADSLPFLFVMEAELEVTGVEGTRRVNINNFYSGYKKMDLRAGELLTAIRIPLPAAGECLRLFKVSRRRDLDISTFTAAVRLRIEGGQIANAAIAYGAVGPVVLRLPKTEDFLTGQPFSEATMRAAGDLAVDEITPISDVRGSADYRYQLARNVLLKLYREPHGFPATTMRGVISNRLEL